MEFIDDYDESRPRLIFQSRSQPSSAAIDSPLNSQKNKPLLIISLSFSLIFLGSSFFFLQSQIINPLFLWLSLSFLIGPFAPISLTAGDIRVGQGKIVDFPPETEAIDAEESKKKLPNRRNRGKRSEFDGVIANGSSDFVKNSENLVDLKEKDKGFSKLGGNVDGVVIEEKEWSEEDLGLLRKLIVKYPVGKPKRWEVIAEGFKGRHSVESVISKAKSLGKEKPVDSDSYSKFLKDRKAVDKRVEDENVAVGKEESGGEVITWSSTEDIALLNALKAFPKEVAMRWEKIAAAVPGKTKAACMKRVSELKKEFRSSKAS
ncbi:dnaJ homolog subfamily C member 2-like [Chenopodium quinoa]|uniref:dnaJ homolog subfamily C member 2-like n=1 Tax=Chenopodium quinoa TaxID=63459 RepID=UPI000B770EC6|nr:dnaJ homolog subfamily C member 2-like [Chenopodium quinoa]